MAVTTKSLHSERLQSDDFSSDGDGDSDGDDDDGRHGYDDDDDGGGGDDDDDDQSNALSAEPRGLGPRPERSN